MQQLQINQQGQRLAPSRPTVLGKATGESRALQDLLKVEEENHIGQVVNDKDGRNSEELMCRSDNKIELKTIVLGQT